MNSDWETLWSQHGHTSTLKQHQLRVKQYKKNQNNVSGQNFLSHEDRRFLEGSTTGDSLPLCQARQAHLTLIKAVVIGHMPIIKENIEKYGVNVNTTNCHKETLLHLAIIHQHEAIVDYLVSKGADINAQTNFSTLPQDDNPVLRRQKHVANGATPLHYACTTGNIRLIKPVLCPENVNSGDKTLLGTPLMWAIYSNHIECIELLLQNGANAECRDGEDNNLLAIAIMHWDDKKLYETMDFYQLYKVFKPYQLNLNHTNIYGETAYDIAQSNVLHDLLQSLGGKGGKLQSIDHLFEWNVANSRQEWIFQNGKRRLIQLKE